MARLISMAGICLLILFCFNTAFATCKISPNASYTYPVCTAANGSIAMSPTSGTGTYHYQWTNGDTTAIVNHLVAGSYTVTITDAVGCSVSRAFTLTPSARSLSANLTSYSDTCNEARGKIKVTIVGNGNTPYTYTWSNGQTGASATGLIAGSYSLQLTDSNGCSVSASSTITNYGSSITISNSFVQPVCYNSGQISVTASGGTSSTYRYRWSTGSTSPSISNLTGGSYVITVSGTNSCSATSSFTIINPPVINVSASITQPACSYSKGAIVITPTGGAGGYYTLWSNGATTNSISNLVTGYYTAMVTDSLGCSASQTFQVIATSAISISASVIQPICTASNGTITVSSSGGASHYSYAWALGATTNSLSNISSGSYQLTVTDANSCTAVKSFTVSSFMRPMVAAATATGDTCMAHIGQVSVHVSSGGSAPYSYLWSNGSTTNPVSGLGAHYYTVVVTDSNGCSATAGSSVSNIGIPIVISTSVEQPLCYGNTGSASITAAGGTGGSYNAVWSNGDSGFNIGNLPGGVYTVTVTGSDNCKTSKAITVIAPDSITMNYNVTNIHCDSDAGGALTLASITGAVYPWSTTWTGPNGYTSSDATIFHLTAGTYTVNLFDANRCTSRATYVITSSGTIIPRYTVTNTSCNGANNGAIARQALSPYSTPVYSWSGPSGFTSDSVSLKNLAPGIYSLTITEPFGCSGTGIDTVKAGPPIAITYTIQNTDCDSARGGALTETSITGATYPWSAFWTGPYGYSSNSVSINRLMPGQYHLNFTDQLGCSINKDYIIDSLGAIKANYAVSNTYCATNNGSINLQLLIPYSTMASYNWTSNNGFTSANQSISGLTAGTYYVTVTEDFGCHAFGSFDITNSFDVGVASIKYINMPAANQNFILHPLAGDMSQLNGGHCAAGISGQVQLIYSGPVHYIGVTASGIPPTSMSGDTLTWNVPDFGTLNLDSSFFLIFHTNQSALLDASFCTEIIVTPLIGDNNILNNTAHICLGVVRSYDPNEKQVYPYGNLTQVQKTLTYTIHFQNTGTGAAQNVNVLDTLDSSIDPATLTVAGSSSPVETTTSANAVKFSFTNINLPNSATDAAGSQGFVQYIVNLKDNLPLGTTINNTAYIYFDYNAPITTNTTVNQIVTDAATSLPATNATEGIILFPNPAHKNLLIEAGNDCLGGKIEIIDALGRRCASYLISTGNINVSIGEFAAGIYLVNVVKPHGVTITRKLIIE